MEIISISLLTKEEQHRYSTFNVKNKLNENQNNYEIKRRTLSSSVRCQMVLS